MFVAEYNENLDILTKDVDLCKLIAVKDADYFVDRMTFGVKYTESKDEVEKIFGLFLTNMTGDAWKKMRNLATPVFTSGKLKLMAPHINKVKKSIEIKMYTYLILLSVL